jgi:Flp pilus assembly protein TadD
MADSILTRGQRRLHVALMALAVFMTGNAAYLFAARKAAGESYVSALTRFYQSQLVLHVAVGILVLAPMTAFVVWHMRRALAMHNRRAVWTGIAVTVAAFALLVTGLFLFRRANSAENRWAFVSHQTLAVVAAAGYVVHRFLSHHRPARWAVRTGFGAVAIVFAGSLAIHLGTLPPAPAPQQAFVAKPPDGVDPWKDRWYDFGPGGADPASVFAPASTQSQTGGFLKKGLLTNDDLATQSLLDEEIAKYGFAVKARIGSETCARCHADIVEQWSKSAHRYASFDNPFYRASVEAIRKEDNGKQRSQWCAGCHDPAIMMAGNMTKDIVPTIPESQAGLTCLACHLMDEVHGVGGNGGYRIADAAPDPYLYADAKSGVAAEIHDALVKSKPDVHKRDMLKPVFRTSEYCGTCHKVSLDVPVNHYRWVRGQNEYDNHQDSGVSRNNARTFYLPPEAKRCQDCHMPLVPAPLGDVSAKGGFVRSHQFLGPNTALPFVRGDTETQKAQEDFLKDKKLRVDVFAVKHADGTVVEAPDLREVTLRAGETVEFDVVVRNLGVGHTFPGGTLDSNEAWIEFTAYDADRPRSPGGLAFASGLVDYVTKAVDRNAHFYRVVFVDEHGNECDRRNPQDFRAAVHTKVIGPGTADLVRYRLVVPDVGRLAVRAVVKWRKFTRQYTEFAWTNTMQGRAVPELPITDIAAGQANFPVSFPQPPIDDISDPNYHSPAPQPPLADIPAARLAEGTTWQRWNDWGIGCLLERDTAGAERAFRFVSEHFPKLPDGPRNLARTKLADGDVAGAIALLQEADRRDPGNPQTAYFFGVAREKAGQLDDAITAFEAAREAFPGDRTIHTELGQIRFRLGRYDEALKDFLRVLAIDPEDRTAHWHRFLIYKALGDEKAADEAEKAFEKYTIDESAQEWTNEFRLNRPDVNLESQLVHVHDLVRR